MAFTFGDHESFCSNWRLEKFKFEIETFRAEELVDQGLTDLLIIFIVNFASENTLSDQRSQGIPWDLVGIYISSSSSHAIKPLITANLSASLICLVECIHF
jgi:hypothetical protein